MKHITSAILVLGLTTASAATQAVSPDDYPEDWTARHSTGFKARCQKTKSNPKYTEGSFVGIATTKELSSTYNPTGNPLYEDRRRVDGLFVLSSVNQRTSAIEREAIHLKGEMHMMKLGAHGLYLDLQGKVGKAGKDKPLTLQGELVYNSGTTITWKNRTLFVPCTFQWLAARRPVATE